ncbi:hypothetical protein KSP39_PZI018673 [Platanthera zijinensis]|uniref:Uncharacterized protein n=1 Tax=Platanthera zijinensis TaxID=2320716 RepID=A0AAP0FYZ7_9ASPA
MMAVSVSALILHFVPDLRRWKNSVHLNPPYYFSSQLLLVMCGHGGQWCEPQLTLSPVDASTSPSLGKLGEYDYAVPSGVPDVPPGGRLLSTYLSPVSAHVIQRTADVDFSAWLWPLSALALPSLSHSDDLQALHAEFNDTLMPRPASLRLARLITPFSSSPVLSIRSGMSDSVLLCASFRRAHHNSTSALIAHIPYLIAHRPLW